MITSFRYVEPLYLVRQVEGLGALFEVERPYSVEFRLDGVPIRYTVEAGLVTDLASIPDIVPKWISQRCGKHLEAAVVHDALYRDHSHGWDRAVCDAIFLAGMTAAGEVWWRALVMYRCVRWFGGSAWREQSGPMSSWPNRPR